MSGEQLDIETCPDCGRPKADETHIDGACYKGSGDALAAGECAERTVERLRSRIAELEAALAAATARASELEREAAAAYVYQELGDDAAEVADDIRAGLHIAPDGKGET